MSDAGYKAEAANDPGQPQAQTTLEQLKKMLDDFRSSTEEARKASLTYRDYYDCKQLTDDEKRVLNARKQPPIIVNRVRRAVNGIMGVVENSKTDPRAYLRNPPPRIGGGAQPAQQAAGIPLPGMQQMGANGGPPMPAEEDAGDIASKVLRYITDTNHFQPLKMDVLENFLIEGSGAALVEWDGQEVRQTQIRWEELVYDPRSRRADFKDARFMGIAKWMYADQAAALTQDAEKKRAIESACEGGGFFGWFKDRPTEDLPWVDKKQKRVLVAELYYQEQGQWWRAVFITNTIIDQAPSAYKNDKGEPVCNIEAVSCYVDRENHRYGEVKDMIGPQDGLNMSHSKRLHAANSRQVQPIDGNAPPVDADEVRAQAARPDGVLPPGWKIADNNAMVAHAIEGIQEFKGEMERAGPNPAILGRQGADASGRAVLARQQAGLTEMARPLGRFNDWELRMYHLSWWCARQNYTAPKWIRVTDDEGAAEYVQINEPAPVDPVTQQPIGAPKKHVAQMDVDIVVDSVPDTANIEQEQFATFAQLAQAYAGTPDQVPLSFMVKLSAIPKRQQLAKELEEIQAQRAMAAQPAQQIQMAGAVADVEKTKSETEKNLATANKTQVDAVRSAMQGQAEAMNPHVMAPPLQLDQPIA